MLGVSKTDNPWALMFIQCTFLSGYILGNYTELLLGKGRQFHVVTTQWMNLGKAGMDEIHPASSQACSKHAQNKKCNMQHEPNSTLHYYWKKGPSNR